LVIGLVALALGLASFAIWFQWNQTRRCLAFYGSQAARLIQHAPRVEVWEPAAVGGVPAPGLGTDPPGGPVFRFEVTSARGLVHLRRGLVEDANLDWDSAAGPPSATEAWSLAFAFFDSPDSELPGAVLLIERSDGGARSLRVAGRAGRVGLGRLARGIDRWWAEARSAALALPPEPGDAAALRGKSG